MVVALASIAQATLYTYSSGTLNAAIPDGNPVGITETIAVPNLAVGSVLNTLYASGDNVTLTLNISGTWNGDLYGYLVSPNGTLVQLLNRVGTGSGSEPQFSFGFADPGMNVTLDSGAGSSIHNANGGGSLLTGTYQPDGGDLTTLNGSQAGNGSWTLFLADLSGGNTSTLVSWGLSINVVPEPTTWAIMIFGAMAGITALWRSRK